MPRTQAPIARYVHKLLARHAAKDLTDAELLTRYAEARDEAAFATLVERHGPLVWNVCRRILPCAQDAEDAFQAVFLVLARKSRAIRKRASVASWLYGVAYRIGMKERQRAARRREPLRGRTRSTEPDPAYAAAWHDLQRVLDEELNRLPEKYRSVLVLCCLEGLSKTEAAATLGLNEGTLSSRLARGRKLLQERLTGRGVTVTAALLAAGLGTETSAASPLLMAAAVRSVAQVVFGGTTAAGGVGAVSARVLHMADSAVRVVTLSSWKIGAGLILAACAALAASAVQTPADDSPMTKAPASQQLSAAKQTSSPEPRSDRNGDPLPARAITRLGTVRFRQSWVVLGLAYSPDGKMLAMGGAERGLGLWDAETGKQIRQFETREQISQVAFSPDGKFLAATRSRGGLWEVATGNKVRELGPAYGLAFSPDGKKILLGDGSSFRLEDTQSGTVLLKLPDNARYRSPAQLSPDGKRIAIGSGDGAIHIWSATSGKEVHRLTAHEKGVYALAFSPRGPLLASGGNDASIRLWDVTSGKELRRLSADGEVRDLKFSRDGKLLAAGCDGSVRVWNIGTGKETHVWPRGIGFIQLDFSPDGKTLAVVDTFRSTVRRWNVLTGEELPDFGGHRGTVTSLAFAGDGKTLFSTSYDRTARAWDLASGRDRVLMDQSGTKGFILNMALAPDHKTIAFQDRLKSNLTIWETGRDKALHQLKTAPLFALAFSPNGRILVGGGGEGNAAGHVTFWDAQSAKVVAEGKTVASIKVLAFAPDGHVLATGGHFHDAVSDCTIQLWDPATGKHLGNFDHHYAIGALAFSPDGAALASTDDGAEGRLYLWDVSTQKPRWTARTSQTTALAFSPDGRMLAAGGSAFGSDSFVTLWETASGKPITRFQGHHSGVMSLAFSPNGRSLASGGGDSQILLWDITERNHGTNLRTRSPEQLWTDLAADDATRAYEAIWALLLMPKQAVALTKERLRPETAPDPKRVAALVSDLDSPSFKVRAPAARALRELGDPVSPSLRAAAKQAASLESKRRMEKILNEIAALPRRLQTIRALQVLEYIGSTQARDVVETLARGLAGTVQTTEAEKALRRWMKR